jgi:hypothetical protein
LYGAERHVDVVGIVEQHIVISERVAVRSRPTLMAPGASSTKSLLSSAAPGKRRYCG